MPTQIYSFTTDINYTYEILVNTNNSDTIVFSTEFETSIIEDQTSFIPVQESMTFTEAEAYCQHHYGTHLASSFRRLNDIDKAKALCSDIGIMLDWIE